MRADVEGKSDAESGDGPAIYTPVYSDYRPVSSTPD